MSALENLGLRVIEVDAVEDLIAHQPGPADARPHAVRLDARRCDWTVRSQRDDVVIRPRWLHWVCPASGGAAGVMARQSPRQRQRSRKALAALGRLDVEICAPIEASRLDEWAVLYQAQVRQLGQGRNLAGMFRRALLQPDSGHGLVGWRDGGRLVCGAAFAIDPSRSALIGRFAAVAGAERDLELPRAMYLTLADMAAARGLRWVTLGTDVNLAGAMISPGLSAFKMRLGFRPVPADLFGIDSQDVAERLTSVHGLTGPVLRFEYQRPRPSVSGVADFFDGADTLGLVSTTAIGGDDAVLRALPAHRRLVLES
jgi:hypothetical protein